MRQVKLRLLTDKLFLLGLITLLINDLVLKYEFGGLITGKLSDISGLFIFPFFWSIFFERHSFKIYLLTVLLFVFWKLPMSTDFINSINQTFSTKLNRVTDYTDLLTLFIVPISYRHLNRILETYDKQANERRTTSILVSLASLFAFVATSQPRQEIEDRFIIQEKLICSVSKDEIFKNRIKPGTQLSDKIEHNLSDSLFLISFRLPDENIHIETWVKIYRLDDTKTVFEIDSLKRFTVYGRLFNGIEQNHVQRLKNLKRSDFIDLFKENVIKQIENKDIDETDIYFNNPKVDYTVRQ